MNKLIIKLIDWYKSKISPNTKPKCRYCPTCSSYARSCFERFNFFKALILSIYRIIRCNPLSKGGYNPPPKNIHQKYIDRILNVINKK